MFLSVNLLSTIQICLVNYGGVANTHSNVSPHPSKEVVYPKLYPQYGIFSTNITRGRDAVKFAPKPLTADILAGSEIGFKVINAFDSYISHLGPAQFYLAKALDNVALETWSGIDADWVKVAYFGAVNDTTWFPRYKESEYYRSASRRISVVMTCDAVELYAASHNATSLGKYIFRIDHLWPQNGYHKTQWYISCAHINVINHNPTTTPLSTEKSETTRFPGTYTLEELCTFLNHSG